MEGTWQWEQRKHCHIILLNSSSYLKENPEQVAALIGQGDATVSDERKRLHDCYGKEADILKTRDRVPSL
ncbi:Uncharacterized protein DBV15_05686 [Temnothorax longispinosus]|uniref:Uncharacterized protein n=1 Tax=Temnothorax longispinosus TaxID=300112 RepID=A0A4S2JAK2_9HYME|nr:Uncharacterized protein DBV15_05686 [Temnothorax longispinosus]